MLVLKRLEHRNTDTFYEWEHSKQNLYDYGKKKEENSVF